MAMKMSFFKTYTPRRFKFTTRHYDPDKEERELRNIEIAQELGVDDDRENRPFRSNIKGQFRRKSAPATQDNIGVVQSYSKTIGRIIMLVTIALFLVIMYLITDWIPFTMGGK